MNKLSLLVLQEDSKNLINDIQKLSTLHIELNERISSQSDQNDYLLNVKKVLEDLKTRNFINSQSSQDIEIKNIVRNHLDLIDQTKLLKSKLIECENIENRYNQWFGLNQELVNKLSNSGWFIGLLILTDEELNRISFDYSYKEILTKQEGKNYIIILISPKNSIPDLNWLTLPSISKNDNQLLKLKTKAKLLITEDMLNNNSVFFDQIEKYYIDLRDKQESNQVFENLHDGKGGKWKQLIGYFPSNDKYIYDVLNKYNIWYEVSTPSSSDNVPITLHNNSFNKPFEFITKIFSLPNYHEFDPTPFFAPFFSLFFGLCLADAGYGLLLLLLVLFTKFKFNHLNQSIFSLLLTFSITTMLCGVLFDAFFGSKLFVNGEYGWFPFPNWIAIFSHLKTDNGITFPVLPFSILIGFIQLCLGITLKSFISFKRDGFLFTLLSVGKLLLLFSTLIFLTTINFLDLGKYSILNVINYFSILIIGVFFIITFVDPSKGLCPYYGAKGLWSLYQFITSMIGDILSYLRLFALGLAGGLLGTSINQIAFMTITDINGQINYWNWNLCIFLIILIFGHLMNFLLAGLGAFVHPLRLTFVEFYKSIDFIGGGLPYKPLSKNLPCNIYKE